MLYAIIALAIILAATIAYTAALRWKYNDIRRRHTRILERLSLSHDAALDALPKTW